MEVGGGKMGQRRGPRREAAHGDVGEGDELHEEHRVRVQARARAHGIDKARGSWGGVRGAERKVPYSLAISGSFTVIREDDDTDDTYKWIFTVNLSSNG